MECLLGLDYQFSLYEDRQLIFLEDSLARESFLSEEDIESLLSRIEETGINSIEGTGELRELDPIYNDPPEFVETGGGGFFLKVWNREFHVELGFTEYLVDPIRSTRNIIDSYRPNDSHLYTPNEIYLWVFPIDSSKNIDWYPSTPIPPIQEWPDNITSLDDLMASYGSNYADIPTYEAVPIIKLFRVFPSGRVFTQHGQEYYVIACPITP